MDQHSDAPAPATPLPLELQPFAVDFSGGHIYVRPKPFGNHWFDYKINQWPMRYRPIGATIGVLVGVLGLVLIDGLVRELLGNLGFAVRAPLAVGLFVFWGILTVWMVNLPRFFRHKGKPRWLLDPSADQVTITNPTGGVRAFPFSDMTGFVVEGGEVRLGDRPVHTFAVYGETEGERVLLGWFSDEIAATRLRDKLRASLVENRAAYEWNKKNPRRGQDPPG